MQNPENIAFGEQNPFFFKSIRSDNFDFWAKFCYGIAHDPSLDDSLTRFPLRAKKPVHGNWGWRSLDGVYQVGVDKLFTKEQKQHYSKHQSCSIASPKDNFCPPVFGIGKDRESCLVGVRMVAKPENMLVQRLLSYDGGTVNANYREYLTREQAQAAYDDLTSKNKAFNNITDLIQKSSPTIMNEAMLRMRWNCDNSAEICVFTDTLEARLLAQVRAQDLTRHLKKCGLAPADYQVPISFYLPKKNNKSAIIKTYDKDEQNQDREKAKSSRERDLARFYKLSANNFEGFDSKNDYAGFTALLNIALKLASSNLLLFFEKEHTSLRIKFLMKTRTLLLALKNQPQALPQLMEMMKDLSLDNKTKIFMQTDSDGYNALMLAAQFQPQALPHLMEMMKGLSLDNKTKIFMQTDSDRYNALMLAARFQPQAVPHLMEMMEGLSLDNKTKIFMKTSFGRYNALMLAAWYQPQALPHLMEMMKGFSRDNKIKIFMQTSSERYNALMIAAQLQPQALPVLMEMIEGLSLENKTKIFMQTSSGRCNALMIAALCNPQALPHLTEMMKGFSRDNKIKIFMQTTSDGYAALFALLPVIFVELDKLPTKGKIELLRMTQINPYWFNLINTLRPNLSPEFFKNRKTSNTLFLKFDATKNDLTMFNDCLNVLRSQRKDINLQFITNCMAYELAVLQGNWLKLKEKSAAFNAASTLCDALLKSMTSYENDKDLPSLNSAWHAAIKNAQPILSNHIDYKNIFINITFIVLSLGIFLVGLGIRSCVSKNEHSFFLPVAKTAPMKCLEKLVTLAEALPTEDVKSISAT